MQQLSQQLTLGLSLKDEATFDNFYAGNNQEIISELKKAVSGTSERVIYLCGSRGQGCTHLLQACCHDAQIANRRSVYLPMSQLQGLTPELLQGLESLDLICIDDLQAIGGKPEWEEAIFHLYNRAYDANRVLMLAAHDLPKSIGIQLPDLVSRLSSGVTFQLRSLSDNEKLSALMMRAHRRGMTLSDEVAKYILTHCPRHMGTLFAALDALDKATLAAQRRLTIPFVKDILQI